MTGDHVKRKVTIELEGPSDAILRLIDYVTDVVHLYFSWMSNFMLGGKYRITIEEA